MTADAFEMLRRKGYLLAGRLSDLSQRACVYHHMYEDSGRRNVFPLIAAHGALWAAGYFRKGMLGGRILSVQYLLRPRLRRERLISLCDFADKFRDVNRRVCAESYAIYHYTKNFESNDFIRALIGEGFSRVIYNCHKSREEGTPFSSENRKLLFFEFFSWEQENIVAPSIVAAYENFCWMSVAYLARRPNVQFAYFGKNHGLKFCDFSSKAERMEKGMLAYQRAVDVGLELVEASIQNYKVMPRDFFKSSVDYYQRLERVCEA